MAETTELLISVLRDLLDAEADYRSAMNIYADHPNHRARIRAESVWWHSKNVAKCVLHKLDATSGQDASAVKGGGNG